MDNKKIGEFITEQRKAKGLNQKQLAERLNVTDKAISRWETGKGMPETSLLKPLANELGVSVSELLSGESEAEKADKIIIDTLNESKKKTKIAAVLLIVISILLCSTCITHYFDSKKMINNIETAAYDVRDNGMGGFIGITIDFEKSSKTDGYEFMCYFNEETGTSIVDSYKPYPAEITSYYFGTQDGPSKIRIRAYDEQDNGEKLYTDWITVLDMQDEGSIDFDNLKEVNADEWLKLTENSTYFDPYAYN